MRAIQWSMTIPKEKQKEFEMWFKKTAGPIFAQFGSIGHEIYKVEEIEIVGHQVTEQDRYIERVFFADDFEIPEYFAGVKQDPEAWKLYRMYENEFRAKDIELRVLDSISGTG